MTVPLGSCNPGRPRSISSFLYKSGAQISSWLSLLKDSSSAPATVPVASNGSGANGDHAKVDVLWISFSFIVLKNFVTV